MGWREVATLNEYRKGSFFGRDIRLRENSLKRNERHPAYYVFTTTRVRDLSWETECGVLWEKIGRYGRPYLSGKIFDRQVCIFNEERVCVLPPAFDPDFAELDLDADATKEEVKAAYRKKVLVVHPDKGGTCEDFVRVHAAYEAALQKANA